MNGLSFSVCTFAHIAFFLKPKLIVTLIQDEQILNSFPKVLKNTNPTNNHPHHFTHVTDQANIYFKEISSCDRDFLVQHLKKKHIYLKKKCSLVIIMSSFTNYFSLNQPVFVQRQFNRSLFNRFGLKCNIHSLISKQEQEIYCSGDSMNLGNHDNGFDQNGRQPHQDSH